MHSICESLWPPLPLGPMIWYGIAYPFCRGLKNLSSAVKCRMYFPATRTPWCRGTWKSCVYRTPCVHQQAMNSCLEKHVVHVYVWNNHLFLFPLFYDILTSRGKYFPLACRMLESNFVLQANVNVICTILSYKSGSGILAVV